MSLSLNVPGFPKSNPTVKAFFSLCLSDLRYFLKSHVIDIKDAEAIETCDAAGDFFIVPYLGHNLNSIDLKQICEAFEESHPLGRFIDVDLNDEQGDTVSSGKSKNCFFCNEQPAIECRRENAHNPKQLRSFMFSKMAEYCQQQREVKITKRLSSLGLNALLCEISLTPKPGLVDKFSNGSHADMNYQTFIDSSSAISPWFGELAREGFAFHDSDLTKALPILRNLGLRMESDMYQSTGNINTQKGIIFLLGISLFACGKLYSQNDQFNIEIFRDIIRAICKDLIKNELVQNSASGNSHGEQIFQKYGFSGARGEAESGLRTVFEFGLPQLEKIEVLNDDTLLKCFLAIASNNTDTNILYRKNPDVLSVFQSLCKIALKNFNDKNYSAVIDFCRNENISPGGSADLLAVTIFVWSVINEDIRPGFKNLFRINDF